MIFFAYSSLNVKLDVLDKTQKIKEEGSVKVVGQIFGVKQWRFVIWRHQSDFDSCPLECRDFD